MDYNKIRRKTKKVKAGRLYIGGDSPVTVQSMTNADTRDVEAACAQIDSLVKAGCEIVRMAVPDKEAAAAVSRIKERFPDVPLVADIHYDYRLAVMCAEAGIDKIRINPGNIGSDEKVREVVKACRQRGIPIRIGVNSGSVEKRLLEKYGSPTPQALAESALGHAGLLERFDFDDIIIAVKASNPYDTIAANRILAEQCCYPLHIGVTEAGTAHMGIIKSSVGIGSLLCSGIGDTIRVSLTADPVQEVTEGLSILKALGIRRSGVNVISCPTCGRTKIDLIALVNEFERIAGRELRISRPITVALMGCAVNGPGEAAEADIGIAGSSGEAVIFRHGQILCRVAEENIIRSLIDEINKEYGI